MFSGEQKTVGKLAEEHATMQVGDWAFALPRYMQNVLEVAGLTDGGYTVEEFVEKIQQVEYVKARDGEISLFVNIAKLLFVQFAEMAGPNEQVGVLNVRQRTAAGKIDGGIDLVKRALPEPNTKGA